MPSFLVGNMSGGDRLISGNPWSGTLFNSQIELRWPASASGNCYVALSGNITVNSGGYFLSGGGLMDGRCLSPGGVMFIPKNCITVSGAINVYVTADSACSGRDRISYEIF